MAAINFAKSAANNSASNTKVILRGLRRVKETD